MGQAAENLVLVGDQMQLAQPTLGSHPGRSGESALNYLLDGQATIPPDLGVLLDQTWLLHPGICRFISEAFYDGRLQSHPQTLKQRVKTPGPLITRESGVVFMPVPHAGNVQGSQEEVEAVAKLIDELLRSSAWSGRRKSAYRLTWEDILVVAPFNYQVRLLQEALGPDARVGTVDKFQGQEADVVIVSLASSTIEDSPRGAEFLLEPNRLNVAVSRAKSLAIVVGNPGLISGRFARWNWRICFVGWWTMLARISDCIRLFVHSSNTQHTLLPNPYPHNVGTNFGGRSPATSNVFSTM